MFLKIIDTKNTPESRKNKISKLVGIDAGWYFFNGENICDFKKCIQERIFLSREEDGFKNGNQGDFFNV
jgi:hypothetical protein